MRVSEATDSPESVDRARNFGFLVRDVSRLFVAVFERSARESRLPDEAKMLVSPGLEWARFARDRQPAPQEAGDFAANTHTLSLYSHALELRRLQQRLCWGARLQSHVRLSDGL